MGNEKKFFGKVLSFNRNRKFYSVRIRNKAYLTLEHGSCYIFTFYNLIDNKEHIALVFNKANTEKIPLVRIHSECITGDAFKSKKCDCGNQLDEAIKLFNKTSGIILYLRQEGRGIGLYNKMDAYALQNNGFDTYEANRFLHLPDDLRDYTVAAQMLYAMSIQRVRLVSNNPDKVKQLQKLGIKINERISTGLYLKDENKEYLLAKQIKTGHQFSTVKNVQEYLKGRKS